MKKLNLNFVVSFAIVATLFLESCGTTKYQDMGFGGGDFKSFKSSSKTVLNKNHESLPATRAIESQNAKIDLQEPIENNKIQINNSDKSKIISKILSKTQSNFSKPTGNYIIDKINHVKAKVLQKVTKKISDSLWPNSNSSIGKWLLTIIALSIGLFGFIIVLLGIAEGTGAYAFGPLIAGIGLAIMFIGYLFLIWARNVQ
jgi:amino acid transporter